MKGDKTGLRKYHYKVLPTKCLRQKETGVKSQTSLWAVFHILNKYFILPIILFLLKIDI